MPIAPLHPEKGFWASFTLTACSRGKKESRGLKENKGLGQQWPPVSLKERREGQYFSESVQELPASGSPGHLLSKWQIPAPHLLPPQLSRFEFLGMESKNST